MSQLVERTGRVEGRGAGEIFLLSVTHHSAPLAVRERLALDDAGRRRLLDDLTVLAPEAAAIVTCNRTEVYGLGNGWESVVRARALLAERAGLEEAELAPYVVESEGETAVRHLFRVAAGLDSLVLGEPQILGQVREAAELARRQRHSGSTLDRLFTFAIVSGKRARSETRISQGAGSISHAAVELAELALGDLRERRIVVVGLGEMGSLVARSLASHGVRDLVLCNRTSARAVELTGTLGARVVGWDDLGDALARADGAITATAARTPILTADALASIVARRVAEPLLLIDIAVPRNVEPAAAALPGLRLHDLDALEQIRAQGLESRAATIPQVEAIVEEEVRAFLAWQSGRSVVPVIRQLRMRADTIREQEVEKALRRLGHLDERDRQVVRALSHAITNKLLHTPVTRLKETADEGYGEILADLFGLDDPLDD